MSDDPAANDDASAHDDPPPSPQRRTWVTSLLLALVILAAGAGGLAVLLLTAEKRQEEPPSDPGRLVRAFEAERSSHRVAVTAYGNSRPSQDWTAIAEVRGRAVEVSDRFEPGELLPKDLLLVRVDPTDYELAVTRLDAEVRAKGQELRELEQNEANLNKVLDLQHRQIELAQSEYERQKELIEKNATSETALEAAENAYVGQLTAVQETRNSLALIPVRRDLIQASLEAAQAQLAQARRDLEKCEIRLPFPARCASKSVEFDQYVTVGQVLGKFLALDKAEVVVMVEARKAPAMFPRGIAELGPMDLAEMSHDESIFDRVEVPAVVRWASAERPWCWRGRVTRIASSLDPGTRTVPVIVEVADPYKGVQPGVRPPLLPDVFCEVTLYGATVDNVVVIPREAIRDDRVHLVRDGHLHIAHVHVLVLEEELAVIDRGIEDGDLVVLTDLFPASEGMPLRVEKVANPVRPRTGVDADCPPSEPPAEAAP